MKIDERDERVIRVYEDIKLGEIDLQPDFQRGEVWPSNKKKLLIDSILRIWHVPPIHLVELDDSRFEVLDGQQRLTAIRDFIENKFAIDGSIEPIDDSIRLLNGKKYKDLDSDTKRDFDRFKLKLNEVSDYNQGEPNELFYRLNQTVKLTSSEARNTIYGAIRNDISMLVSYMDEKLVDKDILGFSNSRMAYNDMLSRVVVFLEEESLRAKINYSILNKRYREDCHISKETVVSIRKSIDLMFVIKQKANQMKIKPMLTKASSLNWLYIFSTLFSTEHLNDISEGLIQSFFALEIGRTCVKTNETIPDWVYNHFQFPENVLREILMMYIERSSSRVMSVTSILIRDLIQSISLYRLDISINSYSNEIEDLNIILERLAADTDPKQVIEEAAYTWRVINESS